MEKSVLFIGSEEYLYRLQLHDADFTRIGSPSLCDALKIGNLSKGFRESIELVFLQVSPPLPIGVLHCGLMPNIPNAGVLLIDENPESLIRSFQTVLGGLPTYVYGLRTSVTPFSIREAIDIAFASNHHETAKSNLKDCWGRYL